MADNHWNYFNVICPGNRGANRRPRHATFNPDILNLTAPIPLLNWKCFFAKPRNEAEPMLRCRRNHMHRHAARSSNALLSA